MSIFLHYVDYPFRSNCDYDECRRYLDLHAHVLSPFDTHTHSDRVWRIVGWGWSEMLGNIAFPQESLRRWLHTHDGKATAMRRASHQLARARRHQGLDEAQQCGDRDDVSLAGAFGFGIVIIRFYFFCSLPYFSNLFRSFSFFFPFLASYVVLFGALLLTRNLMMYIW